MSTAERWLEGRLAGVPRSLRARIEQACRTGATQGTDLAVRLRAAAERLLAEAAGGPPTRETALTLLAADALVTLACEWVADTDPEGLEAL